MIYLTCKTCGKQTCLQDNPKVDMMTAEHYPLCLVAEAIKDDTLDLWIGDRGHPYRIAYEQEMTYHGKSMKVTHDN